jgi:hypothetical protein
MRFDPRRLAELEAAVGIRARVDVDARLDELVAKLSASRIGLQRHSGCVSCMVRVERMPAARAMCGVCEVLRRSGLVAEGEGMPLEIETEWDAGEPQGAAPATD